MIRKYRPDKNKADISEDCELKWNIKPRRSKFKFDAKINKDITYMDIKITLQINGESHYFESLKGVSGMIKVEKLF